MTYELFCPLFDYATFTQRSYNHHLEILCSAQYTNYYQHAPSKSPMTSTTQKAFYIKQKWDMVMV